MAKIMKESLIGDVLVLDSGTSQYFIEMGMHCLGCPSSRGESIEEACMVHGTDCEELVEKINEYLASK
jgi:hybrid cluster-associated redox disulfide protein